MELTIRSSSGFDHFPPPPATSITTGELQPSNADNDNRDQPGRHTNLRLIGQVAKIDAIATRPPANEINDFDS